MMNGPDIPDDPARTAGPGELDSDRAFWDSIDVEPDDEDPTPWCLACGAKRADDCHCGPLAEND